MELAHSALARRNGASTVIVSEADGDGEGLRTRSGADHAIDPFAAPIAQAPAAVTWSSGPDVVIEAVGSIATYGEGDPDRRFAAPRRAVLRERLRSAGQRARRLVEGRGGPCATGAAGADRGAERPSILARLIPRRTP